jgi:hypothetical protein
MIVFNPYLTIEGLRRHLDIMRAQGISPKKLADRKLEEAHG